MLRIRLLTLNLYRYYDDWERRKALIVRYIKEQKPDIVLLQECFDDKRHHVKNQAVQLNDFLKFKECVYSVAERLRTENGVELNVPVFDGLACLSKFEIVESDQISLKKQVDDRHSRIIQRLVFLVNGSELVVYHTHFSNRDDWARMHLEESLVHAKSEASIPVIAGDLNIKRTDDILELSEYDFRTSWDVKRYVSLPSKSEVLDYVLIPKTMGFVHIICDRDGLSDHRPLIVDIKIKK